MNILNPEMRVLAAYSKEEQEEIKAAAKVEGATVAYVSCAGEWCRDSYPSWNNSLAWRVILPPPPTPKPKLVRVEIVPEGSGYCLSRQNQTWYHITASSIKGFVEYEYADGTRSIKSYRRKYGEPVEIPVAAWFKE